jgi:hypothetical protein
MARPEYNCPVPGHIALNSPARSGDFRGKRACAASARVTTGAGAAGGALTPPLDGSTLPLHEDLHTTAFALAAGWLLLNPPLGGGKASLNQWTVYHPVSSRSTTFESKAACLAGMDALLHPPLEPSAGSRRGVGPTTSFDHLICVPVDDPRLKK